MNTAIYSIPTPANPVALARLHEFLDRRGWVFKCPSRGWYRAYNGQRCLSTSLVPSHREILETALEMHADLLWRKAQGA